MEMRRRVWCLLYVCDWYVLQIALLKLFVQIMHRQMSKWLSRPLMIDHSSCIFQLPNLRFEESNSERGLPSPFTHITLQCEFIRIYSMKFRDANDNSPSGQIVCIQNEIENWINSLPPVYSITAPDTTWDKSHQYVVFQRHHMHAMAYMIKLH